MVTNDDEPVPGRPGGSGARNRRPWTAPDVVEPYGRVAGEARLVQRVRIGDEDWSRWTPLRARTVYVDEGVARRSVDGLTERVTLWLLERAGLEGFGRLALRVQYGVIPADAPNP